MALPIIKYKPIFNISSLNSLKCFLSNIRVFQMNETSTGPVSSVIKEKLQNTFLPQHLLVINESSQHNVPPGSETHFKVLVVSSKFEGLPHIKRHRMINEILSEELNSGVHALSIVANTPAQWEDGNKSVESSPNCRGGIGK